MTDMPREPLPCPFCGKDGLPITITHTPGPNETVMHSFGCGTIGCQLGPAGDEWITPEYALAAWNTRASELAKAYQAIVELAKELEFTDTWFVGGLPDRSAAALKRNSAIIKTAREQGK